jgi:hypothetical protein
MTAPSNYFYDGQIRRFISQFIRMVSNFHVEFGADSHGAITYQRVPVMYGDPSRQATQIIRNNSENTLNAVPAMAVYIDSLAYDQTRLQDPSMVQSVQIRQRSFDPVTGTYGEGQGQSFTVERLMPVPYKLGLKLDIWTSNTEQKLQLIEQLSQLFNPAMEIQSTDNYVDWASLTYTILTDVNWSSRSVPTGGEEPIDVATMKFDLPIWISTSAKVKRMGVTQRTILSSTDLGTADLDNMFGAGMGISQILSFGQYAVLLQTAVISNQTYYYLYLIRQSDVMNKTYNRPLDWKIILDLYGSFISGSSEIRLVQDNGHEIVGTVTVNPTDATQLIYNPDPGTLPANTLDNISAIIDPKRVNTADYDNIVGLTLLTPATGTSYMLTDDIGSFDNPEGAIGWRGADGQDLVAYTNDIIRYNGDHWVITFDSHSTNTLQYVTNITTGIQYKWYNGHWTKSQDGIYPAGQWMLGV